MGNFVWKSILGWFVGIAICTIITSITLKLNWQDPVTTLIWGYGALGSVTAFSWSIFNSIRKKEMDAIDEKINKKADFSEIRTVQCQIDVMNQTIEHSLKGQEEMHATLDNIYSFLLEHKKD